MKKESYLFVTYCDSDYEQVDNIFLELYKQNIPVKSAKDAEQSELSTLIENATAVMMVLSPSALDSKNVRRSIELTKASDKHLIPYFLCAPDTLDLPNELCMLLNGAAAIPAYEYHKEEDLVARTIAELRPYFPDEAELKKKAKKARNRTIISTVLVVFALLFILGSLPEESEPEPPAKTVAQSGNSEPTPKTEVQTHPETMPNNSPELFDHLRQSTVYILTTDEDVYSIASGSGFFINSEGMVATNHHVLEGGTYFFIRPAAEDNYYLTTVLAADEENDLAILQIDSGYTSSSYLTFSDKEVNIGDSVYVSGYPQGIDLTISNGIVSNNKHISSFSQGEYFLITAAATSGNSGGPVVNASGEVIGVLTAKYFEAENLNFVRPINYLKDLIDKQ